jgi:mTERF domain-containing protein
VIWLLDLGLTKSQVAKAVATYPQILGLSIEHNLKPTFQWFLDLGLTKSQVAKAVARFPHILSYNIEQNLSPKMLVLNEFYLAKRATEMVAKWPQLLAYSYHRLTTRLKILAEQDKIDKLLYAMPLTEHFPEAVFVWKKESRWV